MISPAEIWDAFTNPIVDGPGQTLTHVELSACALGIAAAAGIVLGVACAKLGQLAAFFVTSVANLGRTVPTFAVMALVVALSSIGFWPAVIALILLGVPPILLNAYTGVRDVDPGAVAASRGMGLTPLQVLTRVELPLALPLVFAGVRISAVQIVATAALAGLVGAEGLGVIVLAGITNNQDDVLLAGAIPIAILAVLAQALFAGAERLLTPKGLRLVRGPQHEGGTT